MHVTTREGEMTSILFSTPVPLEPTTDYTLIEHVNQTSVTPCVFLSTSSVPFSRVCSCRWRTLTGKETSKQFQGSRDSSPDITMHVRTCCCSPPSDTPSFARAFVLSFATASTPPPMARRRLEARSLPSSGLAAALRRWLRMHPGPRWRSPRYLQGGQWPRRLRRQLEPQQRP